MGLVAPWMGLGLASTMVRLGRLWRMWLGLVNSFSPTFIFFIPISNFHTTHIMYPKVQSSVHMYSDMDKLSKLEQPDNKRTLTSKRSIRFTIYRRNDIDRDLSKSLHYITLFLIIN
jgi:hypothetical protein